MVKSCWDDYDVSGRRLNQIIRLCETNITTHQKAKDHDLALAYIDRLLKANAQINSLAEMKHGVKMIRRILEKKHAEAILDEVIPKRELSVTK